MNWFKRRRTNDGSNLDRRTRSRHPGETQPTLHESTTGPEPVLNGSNTGCGPLQRLSVTDVPPVAGRLNRHGATARPPKFRFPLEHINAEAHALALLTLIQEEADEPAGQMLNHTIIRRIYDEMCWQNHWHPQGWVKVAKEFRLLTTKSAKPYATFYDDDGRPRRRRVYPIPKRA